MDNYDQYIWNEGRDQLIKRMVRAYNKNENKIKNKPEAPKLTQSQKRKRKIEDLKSRSGQNGKISWRGLE
jgi:hypothetical protein